MRLVLNLLLALVLAAGLIWAPAAAQDATPERPAITIDRNKLLVQPKNAKGEVIAVSFWDDPVLWMREKQQAFYGAMSGAIRKIKIESSILAALTLMALSFGYGVFHAAGPGHGKAVISAWLLATEHELKRGILISFLSALIQALTAIMIVSVLLIAVKGAGAATRDVAGFLESASYLMIAGMGLFLLYTAFRRRPAPVAPELQSNGTAALHRFDQFTPMTAVAHDHLHGPDCGCGHAHVPDAKEVHGDWSFTKAFSLAFAVGIRPCTGALLVLVFANALGLYWAGIASTFAMAAGTFIAVSVIAAIAVYSKKLATRFAGQDDRWLDWLSFGLRIGGGAAIVILGGLLFVSSLGTTNAML